MKFRVFLLFCGIFAGLAEGKVLSMKDWQVSSGTNHTCILDEDGVHCSGGVFPNYAPITSGPALRNPRQVSAGHNNTCALDDEGVHCWGDNTSGKSDVPPLKNPKQVSVGTLHACAIDEDGVHCWGHRSSLENEVPPLKNPRQVSAGEMHSCALDDEGVHCWGNGHERDKFPPLRNPRQVTVGNGNTCVLDDVGVHCWGNNSSGQINVPPLRNPRQVVMGGNHTCALDDEGVHCWGYNDQGQTNVPPLKNPRQIDAGFINTCALDDEGVQCWGSYELNGYKMTDETPLELAPFSFQRLRKTSPVSHFIYLQALENLEKTLSSDPKQFGESRYLFYSLLRPSIEQTSTEYAQTLIPRYQKYILNLRWKTSLPEDIRKLSGSEKNRQVALKHIQASLAVAFEFLSPSEKAKLQPITQKIGIAFTEPNDKNVNAVLEIIEKKQSSLDPLKNSERSAFLVDVINLAASWLKAKVP